jgi:hypothetical protein
MKTGRCPAPEVEPGDEVGVHGGFEEFRGYNGQ